MVVNDPEVLREVRARFEAYERAFMAHDVQALNGFFWNDPAVTRYGIADLKSRLDSLRRYL